LWSFSTFSILNVTGDRYTFAIHPQLFSLHAFRLTLQRHQEVFSELNKHFPMFLKMLKWTGLAMAAVVFVSTTVMAVHEVFQKRVEPPQNARLIAEKKAKRGVKCTPLTNKNCFTLTPAQMQQIKKMQNGLSRKKDQ
jgi:hypothetical protein